MLPGAWKEFRVLQSLKNMLFARNKILIKTNEMEFNMIVKGKLSTNFYQK